MKKARYGTPNGNLWIGKENEQLFYSETNASNLKSANEYDYTASQVIGKYREQCKSPMLVVGTNTWLRGNVPFFVLQQFDLHIMFYPNSNSVWVIELVAINRMKHTEPLHICAADLSIQDAIKKAIAKLVAVSNEDTETINEKYITWLTHWIYRAPKISMKDVLHLDPYKEFIETKLIETVLEHSRPVLRIILGGK